MRVTVSGNDIRDELIFKTHDLVFEDELLLLEPGNLQLVDDGLGCQRADGIIEVPMLNLELFKLLLVTFVVHNPL